MAPAQVPNRSETVGDCCSARTGPPLSRLWAPAGGLDGPSGGGCGPQQGGARRPIRRRVVLVALRCESCLNGCGGRQAVFCRGRRPLGWVRGRAGGGEREGTGGRTDRCGTFGGRAHSVGRRGRGAGTSPQHVPVRARAGSPAADVHPPSPAVPVGRAGRRRRPPGPRPPPTSRGRGADTAGGGSLSETSDTAQMCAHIAGAIGARRRQAEAPGSTALRTCSTAPADRPSRPPQTMPARGRRPRLEAKRKPHGTTEPFAGGGCHRHADAACARTSAMRKRTKLCQPADNPIHASSVANQLPLRHSVPTCRPLDAQAGRQAEPGTGLAPAAEHGRPAGAERRATTSMPAGCEGRGRMDARQTSEQ